MDVPIILEKMLLTNENCEHKTREAPYTALEAGNGGGRVVRWYWVNFQCRGVLQFGLQ